MAPTSFERIIARAALQHGYISTGDVAAMGLDPVVLRKQVARGRVLRVSHGVYRVRAVPTGPLERFARAAYWASGRGVISHRSALVVLGVERIPQRRHGELIELTVPPGYAPRRAGGQDYRVFRHRLRRADVTEVAGIAVTTAERAVIDAHRLGCAPTELVNLIFAAVATGRLSQPRSTWLLMLVRGEVEQPHPDW